MNNSEIKNEIATLLNSVKDSLDRFENQDYIPSAQVDEMIRAIEELYKKSVVFGYLNAFPAKETESEDSHTDEIQLSGSGSEIEVLPVVSAVEKAEESVQTLLNEHLPVEEATVIADLKEETINSPVEKIIVNEPVVEKADNIKKAPLADLKSGIGINDKFQFIAELFAGNGEKYEEIIKQLNSIDTLDSSLLYLEQIRANYQWKEDSGAAERLLELVKRRFL